VPVSIKRVNANTMDETGRQAMTSAAALCVYVRLSHRSYGDLDCEFMRLEDLCSYAISQLPDPVLDV